LRLFFALKPFAHRDLFQSCQIDRGLRDATEEFFFGVFSCEEKEGSGRRRQVYFRYCLFATKNKRFSMEVSPRLARFFSTIQPEVSLCHFSLIKLEWSGFALGKMVVVAVLAP